MNKNRNTKYHAIAEALKNQVENNRFQHQLPTISDLAERWQVSTRTMRKAVNRLKDEGVVRVIRGQGIFPTRLKRQRTHTLGLFLPSARAPLGQQLVRGTQQQSAQFLHSLVVMEYAQDRKGLLENLSLLIREQHVDGIILWVMDDIIETSVAFLKKHPVPFVLVGEPDLQRFSDCHAVTNNDSGAIAEIMMHLLGLGHRRIAFVTNSESRGLRYERNRYERYRRGMELAGLTPAPPIMIDADDQELLKKLPNFTAACCVTDRCACHLLRLCLAHGIRVPSDLSITGYDNIEAAQTMELTTVDQRFDLIGREAVELLMDELEKGSSMAQHRVISSCLLVRSSTSQPVTP